MGLLIRLEDQDGYEVAFMEETELLKPLIPSMDDEAYELLSYVDPYGDTIFNWVQAPALIKDLERAKIRASSEATVALVDRVIALAERALNDQLYLKFSGD